MKKHISHHPVRHHESRTLPGEGRSFFTEVFVPGALAGLIGGTLMALLYMALSAASGQGFWTLPQMIAGMFWRDMQTVSMPASAVLVGLFIHFNIAVAVGVTWALMLPRSRYLGTALLPLSLFFAFVLFVVMNWIVMPHISPPMRREVLMLPWVISHVALGFTLALVVPFRDTRWVARHRMREVPVRA